MRPPVLPLIAAVLVLALAPAGEDAKKKHHHKPRPVPKMQLLSTSGGGGFPNGPSRNGVFSQDRQLASLAAFECDAATIVRQGSNGFPAVFLAPRKRPYTDRGEPWKPGATTLV